MDQPPVETDRMAEEQRSTSGDDEHAECGKREGEGTEHQSRQYHPAIP